MRTLTLGVALWDYQDADGRWHRAFYREQLTVTDDELARGQRAGVFAATPPANAVVVLGPPADSTNPVLVDWLVGHGVDPDDIKGLTKARLWDEVNAVLDELRP